MTDSEIPEVKPSHSVNGHQMEALIKTSGTVASSIKSSSSWDEDWVTSTKGASTPVQNSISTSSKSVRQPFPLSSVSIQQTTMSCPSDDVQWPPCASSSVTPQFGETEKHMKAPETSSMSSFEDIDPFADWPPRPSGSIGGSGTSNNGTLVPPLTKSEYNSMTGSSNSMNFKTNSSWSVSSRSPAESAGLSLNASSSTSSLNTSLNPLNSLGFLEQNQGFPALNASRPESKSTDLGSIFASNKDDPIAPKLAPPPSTAVGRGRGRGRGRGVASTNQSTNSKSHTEQPPLLDLLG